MNRINNLESRVIKKDEYTHYEYVCSIWSKSYNYISPNPNTFYLLLLSIGKMTTALALHKFINTRQFIEL